MKGAALGFTGICALFAAAGRLVWAFSAGRVEPENTALTLFALATLMGICAVWSWANLVLNDWEALERDAENERTAAHSEETY